MESIIKKGGLHGPPRTPKPNIRPVAQNAPREIQHCPSDEDQANLDLAKGHVHVKVYKTAMVYDAIIEVDSIHPRDAEIKEARRKAVQMAAQGELAGQKPDLHYLTIAY